MSPKRVMATIQNVLNSLRIFVLCAFCAASIQCNSGVLIKQKIGEVRELEPISVSHHEDLASAMSLNYLGDKFIVSFSRDTLLLGIVDTAFQLKNRFVRRGRGPGELLAPYVTGQYSSINGESLVNIFDRASNRMLYYSIDSLGKERLVKSDSLSLNRGDMRIVFQTTEGFWGILDNNSQSIFTTDSTGKQLDLHEIHKYNRKPDDFQSMTTAHPSCVKFALAYFSIPRIDIIDLNGELLHAVDFKASLMGPRPDEDDDYFLDIRSTTESIYALLNYSDYQDIVLCLDWDGNLKGSFGIAKSESLCLLNQQTVLTTSHDLGGLVINKYVIPK